MLTHFRVCPVSCSWDYCFDLLVALLDYCYGG